MAVDAKRARSVPTLSRRRETWGWATLGVCVLLLLVGVVVYFQARTDLGPPPVHTSKPPVTSGPALKPGGTLEPAAKRVMVDFVRSGLTRTHLARAWELATPDFRSTVTKKQWLRGELPFAPFPVKGLESARYDIVGNSPRKVLIELFLVPELKSGYVPTRYEVTLERKGAKDSWRVSYFLPYAPPGMYTEPK